MRLKKGSNSGDMNVTLIRHAYVLPSEQGQGVGTALLAFLCKRTTCPILIGTWADADWAIRFYDARGFKRVSPQDKDQLLETYWSVPRRQVETSVVLASKDWFDSRRQ
jgi:GNAT superfamily N-acetyltransferase